MAEITLPWQQNPAGAGPSDLSTAVAAIIAAQGKGGDGTVSAPPTQR